MGLSKMQLQDVGASPLDCFFGELVQAKEKKEEDCGDLGDAAAAAAAVGGPVDVSPSLPLTTDGSGSDRKRLRTASNRSAMRVAKSCAPSREK